ncbi:MAG: PSD1 and planctomycete cytochrome C domain-containing protein [Planctomycetaceae bacterium]|nr:PSD1 and planctomycete cytochrome C domain-containing protein [Planctomycetaceae bacterium]
MIAWQSHSRQRYIRPLLAACLLTMWPTSAVAAGPDFDRDVAPLFAAKCLKCHGAAAPEGGLSLTSRDTALQPRGDDAAVIQPGRPDASELLRRVTATDPSERMPPTGEPLTAAQIDTLRRWIATGASWPDHWAYRSLSAISIPGEVSDGSRNPVDQFIAETLLSRGLTTSPEADRRTMIRRVTVDLWGLLPTIEEVEAFTHDPAPDAYERLVDRLLADPQFGERQARHWMDLVHFAETHGHDQDRPREHAWPYRDYLIRSFNADLPYGRFVAEQVAGDALSSDDPWALIATGFLAAGPWDESSLRDIRDDTVDRQIARSLDRDDIVTTVMSTFASTTVHCARCHQHKFDPISQDDYYALQAVFAATDKGRRKYDADPQIAHQRRALQQQLAALPPRLTANDETLLTDTTSAALTAWEQDLKSRIRRWLPVQVQTGVSQAGAQFTALDDGSYLVEGTRAETDVYEMTVTTDLTSVTGLQLEVLSDPKLPMKGPGRQDNGNLHLNEVAVWLLDAAETPRKLTIVAAEADFNQESWSIDRAIDGVADTAWGIFPKVGQDHRAVFRLAERTPLPPGSRLRVELQQSHGRGHLIGRWRIQVTDDDQPQLPDELRLPDDVQQALATPSVERTPAMQRRLAAAVLDQRWQAELAALPAQQVIYSGSNRFEPDGSFRPAAQPRTIHVLHRGDVTQPRAEAQPGALSLVPGLSSRFVMERTDDGDRRRALAVWLTDPANVLTWRSIANRVWQQHFGRGLVDTPNDFGHLGATPTHPQLLDWLAVELQQRDGSLKHLHRLLVTSRTYRQQSGHRDDMAAVDADNRYLWRMTRSRLDAETVRDSVLHLAGTLDDTMGGPSARQFVQTPGIHVTPNVDYTSLDVDAPAQRRRSVYRFLFRTIPDPYMDALDCPDASQLTPRRNESLTALQALALLNDRVLVRQSEHIAARGLAASGEPAVVAFRTILLRDPRPDERTAIINYAQQHGVANLVRVLFNSNEFVFVD